MTGGRESIRIQGSNVKEAVGRNTAMYIVHFDNVFKSVTFRQIALS
jgi:hypothetical protein